MLPCANLPSRGQFLKNLSFSGLMVSKAYGLDVTGVILLASCCCGIDPTCLSVSVDILYCSLMAGPSSLEKS